MLNGSIWTQNSVLPFKFISFRIAQSKAPKILWAFKGFFFLSLGFAPKNILSTKNGALCHCINVQHWLPISSLLNFLLTVVFEGYVLALLHLMKLLDRIYSEHSCMGWFWPWFVWMALRAKSCSRSASQHMCTLLSLSFSLSSPSSLFLLLTGSLWFFPLF